MADGRRLLLEGVRPLLGRLTAEACQLCLAAGLGASAESNPAESDAEISLIDPRAVRQAYAGWRQRYHPHEMGIGSFDAHNLYCQQAAHFAFLHAFLERLLREKCARGPVGRILAAYCQHFFPSSVFAWFQPSAPLAARIRASVEAIDLSTLTWDLPGYTYEYLVDRAGRNSRGHFLTQPEMIEYVLDRAGYRGIDVVERKLLDPACGSGSFLLHASVRLREGVREWCKGKNWVGSDVAGDAEITGQFIEVLQRNLVGFDLDPYNCFLAEVNLFIQALDDLILLAGPERMPQTCRFAIHNVNSLELPLQRGPALSLVFSEQFSSPFGRPPINENLFSEQPVAPQGFHYVVSNPPFVNRGIVVDAPSYFQVPFYRGILHGDQNTYLLFLRLAAYLVAEDGVVAYVVPLNLFGDRSGWPAREMFTASSWKILSLTRFYSRTDLFPTVLQGVGIVCFQRSAGGPDEPIEVHAGFTVAEAREAVLKVPKRLITDNTPPNCQSSWRRSWLVTGQREAYEIWAHVRQVTESDGRPLDVAALIAGRLSARKGDGNSTHLRCLESPSGWVPLLRAASVVDYGGWQPAAYLDPDAAGPAPGSRYCRYRREVEAARRVVRRVASLTEPQTVVLLKEISGLEMRRPVRGTVVERGPGKALIADDTLVVLATNNPAEADLAYALFGLLTSALGNYLFGLFSTNAHVSVNHLLRLPVPPDDRSALPRLARLGREVTEERRAQGRRSLEGETQLERKLIAIDEVVFDWYRIDDWRWQDAIQAGVPWSRPCAKRQLKRRRRL